MNPRSSDTRILFVSDMHLGVDSPDFVADRQRLLCRFLKDEAIHCEKLFLLGDLFEFWMEYRDYIPKGQFDFLSALHTLTESGVEVHYFTGNHDFNPGSFFQEQLGIIVHRGPVSMQLQGLKIYLLHGDGFAQSDYAYRLLKKVLISRWANALFRLLHPDLGMALARVVGDTSRRRQVGRKDKTLEYEAAARKVLSRGYDALVLGHIHKGFVKNVPEGLFVNTGEWLRRLNFVVLRNGRFTLSEYQPDIPVSSAEKPPTRASS